jgi:putative ATP-binding cassette transporter
VQKPREAGLDRRGVFPHLARLLERSSKRTAWLLTLGVLAFVVANLCAALGVNGGTASSSTRSSARTSPPCCPGSGLIVGLALASATASVCLVHMRMRLQLRWRQWMTSHLIGRWLAERRFYQLNIVGGEGSHPEYRIAEDVRLATEPLVDFVIGLTNALLAAVAFISILWIVGGSLTISAFGAPLTIPGFMVIAAIVYSSLTSLAMFFVGRPLIAAVESKNAGEAQLRYELTSVRDSAENIALIGGDDDARAQLQGTFGELARRWVRVIVKQAHMTWISNGSAVLSPAVPLVIAAPKYLAGDLSLGELMQIATAFAQVQIALNWLVDNAIRLAEWLASAQRVVELNDALDNLETTIGRYGSGNTVVLGHSPDDAIHLQHLSLTQHNGTAMIEGAEVIVGRGEKVLVRANRAPGRAL